MRRNEGKAVARIARDDPSRASTLPDDDPSTTMRGKYGSEFEMLISYYAPMHFHHRQTDTDIVA